MRSPYAFLQQGSEAWQDLRYGEQMATTASRLAAALGIHPYQSRQKTLDKIKNRNEAKEVNPIMKFGIDHEDYVAELYLARMRSKIPGIKLVQHGFMMSDSVQGFGASIDRLVHNTDTGDYWGLEIKTRPKGECRGEIPIYHVVQMLGVAHCYKLSRVDYVCWSPDDETLLMATVWPSEWLWQHVIVPGIDEFRKLRQTGKRAPRMRTADKQAIIDYIVDCVDVSEIPELTQ